MLLRISPINKGMTSPKRLNAKEVEWVVLKLLWRTEWLFIQHCKQASFAIFFSKPHRNLEA